jgi:hypothetical protein
VCVCVCVCAFDFCLFKSLIVRSQHKRAQEKNK